MRRREQQPVESKRLIENQTSQPWGRPMRGIEHVSALGGPRGRWASDLDAIRRPRTSGTDDSLNPGDQRCTPVRSGRLRTRRFRLRRNHMLHMAAGLFHGVRRARHLAARAAPVAFAVALIVPPGGLTRTVPVALANGPTTVTFNFTGGPQMFTVPAGVTSITVDAFGAQGAAGGGATSGAAGGLGGRATAGLAVTPGQVLQVNVGGTGGPTAGGTVGGFGGGGAGSTDAAGGAQ